MQSELSQLDIIFFSEILANLFLELAFCWDVEKIIYYIPEFWSLLDYCIAFCLYLEKWIVTGKSDSQTKSVQRHHLTSIYI